MFEHFPANCTWNMATVWAVNMGGALSEVDDACRPLREASMGNDKSSQEAWFESWKKPLRLQKA